MLIKRLSFVACHNVAAIARNVEYKKKNPDSMGVLLEREEQELRKTVWLCRAHTTWVHVVLREGSEVCQ